MDGGAGEGEDEAAAVRTRRMGSYGAAVRAVEEAAEEILLLWAMQQPAVAKQNSFVRHSSQTLPFDACGHHLTILQSPSSMCLFSSLLGYQQTKSCAVKSTPGVTGAVMWDSGVVLGKFLEHAVDSKTLVLQGKKVVELGSGCGLVGCIATLLGAHVILTDLPDRMRLLKKNVQVNLERDNLRGSAKVSQLTWGDDLDSDFIQPLPDFVLGSDVIYSEGAVEDLLSTLRHLSGSHTTIFLSGELRNDAVLEYFLEAAMEEFLVGHVDQTLWHPDYHSHRVALFVLVKKSHELQV